MTNSGLDPQDQELIAAFIDRRMLAEDRQAFMRRLNEEEALYEVFVETVRFRDQEVGRPATVIEHPASRPQWGRLAAVAALIVVGVVTPVVLSNLPATRYARELVSDGTLSAVLTDEWLTKQWRVTRGASPGTDEFDTAVRLGVRHVDLEVALHLGRRDDAESLAAQIQNLLGVILMSDPFQIAYDEVGELVGSPPEALERVKAIEADLGGFLGEVGVAFDLGQWAEAGVLAARSGNTDLLGSRGFSRSLRGFQKEDWSTFDAAFDEVEGLLGSPAGEMDLSRLETAFETIINQS